jgi:hypothetical protein
MRTQIPGNTIGIQKSAGNPVSGGANHLVRRLYGNPKVGKLHTNGEGRLVSSHEPRLMSPAYTQRISPTPHRS